MRQSVEKVYDGFQSRRGRSSTRSSWQGRQTVFWRRSEYSPLAHRTPIRCLHRADCSAYRGRKMAAIGRRFLDRHSLWHRWTPGPDVPDRLERHQRSNDWRKCPRTGRLRETQHEEASDLSCAIAYDTRHRSRHFAELCAGIMVAAGFRVYFLDGYRSTPELSFLVRYKKCSCGIMVTASHNPPSDNAVKVYWSTGGQVLPPHDKAIIDRVMSVERNHGRPIFDQRCQRARSSCARDEVDTAFFRR